MGGYAQWDGCVYLIGINAVCFCVATLCHRDREDDMNSAQTFIRQVERDAAVIQTVRRARASMELIHLGEIKIGDTGLVIDLTDDIQRLTALLLLLGYPSKG